MVKDIIIRGEERSSAGRASSGNEEKGAREPKNGDGRRDDENDIDTVGIDTELQKSLPVQFASSPCNCLSFSAQMDIYVLSVLHQATKQMPYLHPLHQPHPSPGSQIQQNFLPDLKTYNEKQTHTEFCQYAPCFCPVLACRLKGSVQMLLSHLNTEHRSAPQISFTYGYSFEVELQRQQSFCILIERDTYESDHIFLLVSKHVVNGDSVTVGLDAVAVV